MARDRAPVRSADRLQVNWWWVVGCELVGAVLIGGAFLVEALWNWQGVAPATLVNLGTAFAIAGALFFIERRFVTSVAATIQDVAQTAAHGEVEAQTQTINARLDELSDAIRGRLDERVAEDIGTVRRLDNPSYESVTAALATANRLGALADGVTVQASADPDELAVNFAWGHDAHGGSDRPQLHVIARVLSDDGRGARPHIEVVWGPEADATTLGLRLIDELKARGRWKSDATLDWSKTLAHLQQALELAINSRHRAPDRPHLKGKLKEVIDAEWAITDAGVESISRGFLLPADQFPRPSSKAIGQRAKEWNPAKPDWAPQADWDRVMDRAVLVFPTPLIGILDSSWIPAMEGGG